MRLLIIDAGAHALDLAVRARKAGHDVRWFKRSTPQNGPSGTGLVEMVNDFNPWLRWANLIFVTDNTYYLKQLDAFRQESPYVFGPTEAAAAWEIDRSVGQKVLEKAGIPTLPQREFRNYDEAIAYVKKEDRRFVSKPSGITEDKALSYVAQSPEDMIYMLQRWKKLGKHKAPFILQDFVAGIEMAVGGWFGPGGFNEGWCENWEFKKLMNDNLGVATGEQGTVLRYVTRSKLAAKVLDPLEEAIAETGMSGYIDVNCIIDEKGRPWPLEFTTRPGWPTYQIQSALHAGDPIEWMMETCEGLDPRHCIFNSVAVGVVLTIPDYPYSHTTKKEVVGIPIYGLDNSTLPHVRMCAMMQGEKVPMRVNGTIVEAPCLCTAGDYILVMTATSPTVKDAALTSYRRLKRLNVPNSPMYRTDIGKRLAKELPKLQALGYATGMKYSQSG
jgi:phosphoribosylamine---glycine ligase